MNFKISRIPLVLIILISVGTNTAYVMGEGWKAGFAKSVITPEEFMFMSGYGSRDKPANGKILDVYVRVSVLEDEAGTEGVFIALDLISVPKKMAVALTTAINEKYGIPRASVILNSSHTHSAPALDDRLSYIYKYPDPDAAWKQIYEYQAWLNKTVLETVDRAVKDKKSALVESGQGTCRFAVNRRPPIGEGPYDHDVPVLKISSTDGQKVRGLIYGYACHCTVLSLFQWSGDYAGFSSKYLEEMYPGSVALFFAGCGADQNPLPRRTVELAKKYGHMLAVSVDDVVNQKMKKVEPTLATRFTEIDLAFDKLPPVEQFEAEAKGKNFHKRMRAINILKEVKVLGHVPTSRPYPVQVWNLGNDINWITLGGEVVVDYAIRLKKELGKEKTWVAGYSNDGLAYIPSERVLKEGGYEGAGAMVYYQQPTKWKAGLEDQIVDAVHKLVNSITEQKK